MVIAKEIWMPPHWLAGGEVPLKLGGRDELYIEQIEGVLKGIDG